MAWCRGWCPQWEDVRKRHWSWVASVLVECFGGYQRGIYIPSGVLAMGYVSMEVPLFCQGAGNGEYTHLVILLLLSCLLQCHWVHWPQLWRSLHALPLFSTSGAPGGTLSIPTSMASTVSSLLQFLFPAQETSQYNQLWVWVGMGCRQCLRDSTSGFLKGTD